MTYLNESQKIRSRKSTLVTIEPTKRLQVWTVHSGSVYYKDVDHYVMSVKESTTSLTVAASVGAISAGKFFFDNTAKRLYVQTSGSVDPSNVFISAKFRLFFSDYPCILPYDLLSGFDVEFEARIKSTSDISQEIDPQELFGISLEGSCSVSLINNDGFFDNLYDTFIWENSLLSVYSWFPNTAITEKKIIFVGYISSKSFSSQEVGFNAGDFISQLKDLVKSGLYSDSDGILSDSDLNTPKPRIYGRVAGKKLIGIDKTLEGFTGTGTIAGSVGSSTITGTGTSFLSELSPGDRIIITSGPEEFDYSVNSISSNTSLVLSSELEVPVNLYSFTIQPDIPYRAKNREWHIAGHKLREPQPTVSVISSPNRYTLSSATDIFPEDLLDFGGDLYRVRRVVDDEIVLYSNVQGAVSVSDVVRKSPLTYVKFIGEKRVYNFVENRDYTLTNTTTDCYITLDSLAEFNVIKPRKVTAAITFTSGDATVTTSVINFKDFVRPRDFIRSDSITHTTYYEVLSVADDGLSIELRSNYGGSTITTSSFSFKEMEIVGDDSTIVADCYGYENSGVWLRTASDAVKHLLENDAGLTGLNSASFTEADSIGYYTLGYSIPLSGNNSVVIRDAINDINKSVFGNIYSNSSFEICYSILEADKTDDLNRIETDDIFNFSVQSKSDITKTVNCKYKHQQVEPNSNKESYSLASFDSTFVDNLTGIQKEKDFDIYLYEDSEASLVAQRLSLIYSLSQSLVKVTSDLRFASKSINDKMWINIDRLYKRFGQQSSQKIGIITKVAIGNNQVDLSFSDLGNIFNRVANIADNATAQFSSATDREKMLAGFIVDSTKHLPDTSSDVEANTNLIG